MPKVSVIIPAYNRANLILETLESIFVQTFTDYEIVIVDDGSTDDTRETLQPLVDAGKIRYIYQENAGVQIARNTGMRHARGELITLLDSDDLFVPEKLAVQVAAFEANPEMMFLHSDYSKFDNEGHDLGYRDTSFFAGWIYPKMLNYWSFLIAAPCVMFRRELIDEIGWFNEALKAQEDLDMWRRAARNYAYHHIPQALVRIRAHQSSMSSDKTNAADTYLIYLNQAFEEDPDLGFWFKRRVLNGMYTNVAMNLLGTGGAEQMQVVRHNSVRAIGYWPFKLGSYITLIASLIPRQLRNRLFGVWRKLQYGAGKQS